MEWENVVGNRKKVKKSTLNSANIQTLKGDRNQTLATINDDEEEETKEESMINQMMLGSSATSRSTLTASSASDLPCSILIDILGRLPLKTLIQCRYVCKSWRCLLTESYFYKLYSLHTPTTLILKVKGETLETLKEFSIIESDGETLKTRKMRLESDTKENPIQTSDLLPNFRFQLGNGCNGLICLREIRSREPILVWNPIMGQFVILPKPESHSNDKVVAGFGFCGRTNRYKVLRVFRGKFDPPSRWRVELYDLGVDNGWREIGDAPYPIPSRIPGFYTNNSLHWIMDYNDSSNSELICSFDFVDEVFKVVPPPPIFCVDHKKQYHWSNLGILGGCLSICAIDAKIFRPDVQVWAMQEYGVPESWALSLSIRDPAVDWWDPYRWIQVTNFLRNGEILMLCGHYYVLAYNLRERRFRSVHGLDFPSIAHVPSFVPLEHVLRAHHGSSSHSLNVTYL